MTDYSEAIAALEEEAQFHERFADSCRNAAYVLRRRQQASSEGGVTTQAAPPSFQTAPPGDGGRNPGTEQWGDPPATMSDIRKAIEAEIPECLDRRVPRREAAE